MRPAAFHVVGAPVGTRLRLLVGALVIGIALSAGAAAPAETPAAGSGAIAGVVRDHAGAALYGMQVEVAAVPPGPSATATTGADGRFLIANLAPGRYTVTVLDAGRTDPGPDVVVADGSTASADFALPAPPVPPGTTAHLAQRDLASLNAERAAAGLPAGIVLNPRWAIECAAHDDYLFVNHALENPENAGGRDASPGGAWAGSSAILSEGARWTRRENPWENAPMHLAQLFAPSLSVIGIDGSHGYECATTWPGMLRPSPVKDTVSTYPGDRTRGFPTSELAGEAPFTPAQVAGLPTRTPTGREMFVYLNRAGQSGQAPVRIVRASLVSGHRRVSVRWVDSYTPQIGPYLAGGVIIPIHPLAGRSRFVASVTVADGTQQIIHRWTFLTAGRRHG